MTPSEGFAGLAEVHQVSSSATGLLAAAPSKQNKGLQLARCQPGCCICSTADASFCGLVMGEHSDASHSFRAMNVSFISMVHSGLQAAIIRQLATPAGIIRVLHRRGRYYQIVEAGATGTRGEQTGPGKFHKDIEAGENSQCQSHSKLSHEGLEGAGWTLGQLQSLGRHAVSSASGKPKVG